MHETCNTLNVTERGRMYSDISVGRYGTQISTLSIFNLATVLVVHKNLLQFQIRK